MPLGAMTIYRRVTGKVECDFKAQSSNQLQGDKYGLRRLQVPSYVLKFILQLDEAAPRQQSFSSCDLGASHGWIQFMQVGGLGERWGRHGSMVQH